MSSKQAASDDIRGKWVAWLDCRNREIVVCDTPEETAECAAAVRESMEAADEFMMELRLAQYDRQNAIRQYGFSVLFDTFSEDT